MRRRGGGEVFWKRELKGLGFGVFFVYERWIKESRLESKINHVFLFRTGRLEARGFGSCCV